MLNRWLNIKNYHYHSLSRESKIGKCHAIAYVACSVDMRSLSFVIMSYQLFVYEHHTREALYSNSAVIAGWLQLMRAQTCLPGCKKDNTFVNILLLKALFED